MNRAAWSARRAVAIVACLTACNHFTTGPSLPSGSVRMVPPPQYQVWWDMVQECSGFTGSIADVSWYQLPGAISLPGSLVTGTWYQRGNRILLAGQHVLDGELVRHEMLHALTQAAGHPQEQFQDKCGGIVTCSSSCMADGDGPLPIPDDAIRAAPAILHHEISVVRNPVSIARDGDNVSIVLATTNPFHEPIWFPVSQNTFSVRIEPEGSGPTVHRTARTTAPRLGILAQGRRQQAFDLTLPPGDYFVHGFLAGAAMGTVQFSVSP